MTQQQQAKQAVPYTRGPLTRDGIRFALRFFNKQFIGDSDDVGGDYTDDTRDMPGFRDSSPELLAAAYESYAKHLGPNAVEAAENDLLGRALACIDNLATTMDLCSNGDPAVEVAIENARAILAQAEGGVA